MTARSVATASPAATDDEGGGPGRELPINISETFVAEILSPYRPNARYLKSAQITSFLEKRAADEKRGGGGLLSGTGRFAIPESCYIDDTGHFNAVEFNICFNQLAYVVFGKAVDAGILEKLRAEKVDVPSFADFKRHQLPAMVIVSMESRYYKQLRSADFSGNLTINKISSVGGAWFFFTTINFADQDGVKAKGSVVLAYSPTFAPI